MQVPGLRWACLQQVTSGSVKSLATTAASPVWRTLEQTVVGRTADHGGRRSTV